MLCRDKQKYSQFLNSKKSIYIIRYIFIILFLIVIFLDDANSKTVKLFKPPIGIETIFPVTNIRQSLSPKTKQKNNAYEFWGTQTVDQQLVPVYFSTPISYPWEYTQEGIQTLINALKTLPNVISAEQKYFPTIHPKLLEAYSRYKTLSGKESYILVKIQNWPHVNIMSFPIFTVLTFNYLDQSMSYSDIVTDWQNIMKKFGTMHDLRVILGLEPRLDWQTLPIITHVHLPYYDTPDFHNRYWGGPKRDSDERNRHFLQENSLVNYGKTKTQINSKVILCDKTAYESFSLDNRFRYYYSSGYWFLDWDDNVVYGFSHASSEMTWIRIIRVSLFINVVLSESVKESTGLADNINQVRLRLTEARARAFNIFTLNALESLHKEITTVEKDLKNMFSRFTRIQEALIGYDLVTKFLSYPYANPIYIMLDSVKQHEMKNYNKCINQLFDFSRIDQDFINDRKKASSYVFDIRNNIDTYNNFTTPLKYELSDSLSLLENRRNLLWSRNNSLHLILWPTIGAIIGTVLSMFWKSTNQDKNIIEPSSTIIASSSGAIIGVLLWWLLAPY